MFTAWLALFRRTFALFHRKARPSTPQLTSLEDPDKYLPPSPNKGRHFLSVISPTTFNTTGTSTSIKSPTTDSTTTEMKTLDHRPTYERMTSDTGLLSPEASNVWSTYSDQENGSDNDSLTSRTPTPIMKTAATRPIPAFRRLSQIQPTPYPFTSIPRSYTPMRDAPTPIERSSSVTSASIDIKYVPSLRGSLGTKSRASNTPPGINGEGGASDFLSQGGVQRTGTTKSLRDMISTPITESFMHVDGAFLERSEGSQAARRSGGPLGLNPLKNSGDQGGNFRY